MMSYDMIPLGGTSDFGKRSLENRLYAVAA
jgi:hypothetical protein